MQTIQEKNKRIAQNTLLLYFRMLFTLVVNLYTSRVILKNLGVEDFGIYSVVGGVVSMFSVLTGSFSAAIQRFITFELGKNNLNRLKDIFSCSVTIQIIFSIVVILLAETLGLWFVNNKMTIPTNRLDAAFWVLQLSVATFAINLISIPYNAVIIAHEKMSAFAYISIFETLGKLGIAYAIAVFAYDRLIFYASLMCVLAVLVRFIYGCYSKRHFAECEYRFVVEKKILRDMLSFSGWNFIGAASAVLRDQGGNILLNLFFGPVANAARGIAMQVNHAVSGFANNFMVALNPQITKSYAAKDFPYMMTLLFKGARLSYYILFLLCLPFFFNIQYILKLWLGNVPEDAPVFTVLSLVFALSEAISGPLITAMLATGKIRNYQIIVGGFQMLNVPLAYVLLKMEFPAFVVFAVAIAVSQMCLFARLYMLRGMINLDYIQYLRSVYVNVLLVSAASLILPLAMNGLFDESLCSLLLNSTLCVVSALISIIFIGCNKKEREYVIGKIKAKLSR